MAGQGVVVLSFVVVVATVLLAFSATSEAATYNRPVIGILTQADPGWSPDRKLTQYIAASYVKWIEAAGARVVPLLWNTPQDKMEKLLSKLNGVVFPGGGMDLTTTHPYYHAILFIYNQAKKMNDGGKYFPMWGTCMGFQELSILGSGGADILFPVDALNYTIALNLTSAASSSRFFASATTARVNTILTQQKVTMNNHEWGVRPTTYTSNKELSETFTVLSTNVDRKGQVFASTIEGKKYPFWATQWHPEKPIFEWNPFEDIDHSADSIAANKFTADFFVAQARQSPNRFSSESEAESYLIYHHTPTYTFPHVHDFEQCYFFASA